MSGLAGLVAPGGVLLLGALRRCREYHVFGQRFPTAFVGESAFADELRTLEFDPAAPVIEVAPVAEWSDQGFESICCVWAEKPAQAEGETSTPPGVPRATHAG